MKKKYYPIDMSGRNSVTTGGNGLSKASPKVKPLEIKTPIGFIKAEDVNNSEYPGIMLSVDGKGLIIVEYDKDKHKHVIRVCDDEDFNDGDYDYIQIINEDDDFQ